MFDLSGRRALVTGASGSIGESISRIFVGAGAEVYLHGTRVEKLESLSKELGSATHVVTANLSDRDATSKFCEEMREKEIDILVNNAGVTRDGLFVRMSDEDWDLVLRVNLTAAFELTRSLVYPMMRRKYGRVISISSVVGVMGNAGQGNYCASKAGLIGMTKSLASEIASRGVTVNCIAPGFIESPMTDALNDQQRDAILSTVPMNRLGGGIDIGSAALYLASGESSYVTGQTLHINGGMAMI